MDPNVSNLINNDKVNLEDLMKGLKIGNVSSLNFYLIDTWKVRFILTKGLNKRNNKQGIDKDIFAEYYRLPGFISERLFDALDLEQEGYLTMEYFTKGLMILFTGGFKDISQLIFNIYDIERKKQISKDNITKVFSYIPLNELADKNNKKMPLEKSIEDVNQQIEARKEIEVILGPVFKTGNELLDIHEFMKIVMENNSEILLFLLTYLLESKPFSNKTLKGYGLALPNSYTIENVLVMTPKIRSSHFSPCFSLISRTPAFKANPKIIADSRISDKKKGAMNILGALGPSKKKNNNLEKINEVDKDVIKVEPECETKKKPSRVSLKEDFSSFKNFEKLDGVSGVSITSGQFDNNLDIVSDEDDEEEEIENFIIIAEDGVYVRKWAKLNKKDICIYDIKNDSKLKYIINLSGVFVEETEDIELADIDSLPKYGIELIFKNESKLYYFDSKELKTIWLKAIRRAIGYTSIEDIYEVLGELNRGKFGIVNLGRHKKLDRRVAIKIINKKAMQEKDLGQLKTEIEILKICRHQNIISLYDIFENSECLYIIMEYCYGSDLFGYLEQRDFELSEKRAAELVFKLCKAIHYLHQYGIIHRDIKPENILMTHEEDDAEPKLSDFGLSKFLTKGDECFESHGTISYVCPEILLKKSYTPSADIWSLGVLSYMLIQGTLPFDDEEEEEIKRLTINEEPNFTDKRWKKQSKEARQFCKGILDKNPSKRTSINDIIQDPWFKVHGLI